MRKLILPVAIVVFGFTGCNQKEEKTSSVFSTSGFDVYVERGPILGSSVTDGDGNRAYDIGGGKYRFQNEPKYPILADGGVIDTNGNSLIDENDTELTFPMRSYKKESVTLLGHLMEDEEIKNALMEVLDITDESQLLLLPSESEKVAAITNVLFGELLDNEGVKPEDLITPSLIRSLENDIDILVAKYESSTDFIQDFREDERAKAMAKGKVLGAKGKKKFEDKIHGMVDLDSIPLSDLTDSMKDTMTYLLNYTKMSKDLYTTFNSSFSNDFLEKSANGESKHMEAVEALVSRYDLNVSNSDYDSTYTAYESEGTSSLVSALEIGCKVEVGDISEINGKLETETAEDVVAVLEQLKRGSYHQYFGFNKALEEEGIGEGCCSLGDDYCLEAEHKIMRPKKRH